jgi:hypothetical protein
MEEGNRNVEGRREDRSHMSSSHTNYSVVILSRADGEGSHKLSSVSCLENKFERFLAPLGMANLLWH